MTIDTSASLGTISQVLEHPAQYPDVELGVAPMPGPRGNGGVLVGGAALWIVKKSAPEKQAAAWEYVKFLDTAETQATWAAGTGYVPIVESAADSPAVQDAVGDGSRATRWRTTSCSPARATSRPRAR